MCWKTVAPEYFDHLNNTIEHRSYLADEVLLALEDVMVETQLDYLMKRLEPMDYQLMRMIRDLGPVYYKKVYEEFDRDLGRKILTRLKSWV